MWCRKLLTIRLRVVRSAPVAFGLFTSPSWMPLADTSVKTLPCTVTFWVPLPRSSAAPPRWANPLPVNRICCAYRNDTLPGVLVHAPYGHVPPVTSVHRPCVLPAPVPVSVHVAWTSENPSGVLGRSQVAYESCR